MYRVALGLQVRYVFQQVSDELLSTMIKYSKNSQIETSHFSASRLKVKKTSVCYSRKLRQLLLHPVIGCYSTVVSGLRR